MKNVSLIFNVVLTVAVIALFVLHFSSRSKQSQSTSSEVSAAPSGSIVYIQIDSLMKQYDMFNDLRSELENKAQTIQDDLSKKGRAFERDVNDFKEKVQKGLITRAQAEGLQQQLASREQELQGLSQQKQMEMAEEEGVLVRKVMDALNKYLAKYNQEKKFALIITTSGTTNTVITADSTFNITKEVVAGLNDEYIKTKNNK